MSSPAVSIIIPTFNAGQTIEATLESIQKQEFQDFEVLIMDGGSKDSTMETVGKFPFVKAFSEPDKGIYDAMNKGIVKAQGDYLYFLGANDILADPWVLKEVFENLEDKKQLIFGHISYKNLSSKKIPPVHNSSFDKKIFFKNTLHHQGVFYRKDVFDDLNFNSSYKVLADYDLNLKLFNKKVSHSSANTIIAHCDASGISKQFNWSLYKEELKMKKKHFSLLMYYFVQVPWIIMKYLYKYR